MRDPGSEIRRAQMKSMFIVLLVATSAAAQSAPRDVDITSADGTRL